VLVPDVNVLLYAYNIESSRHAAMKNWWERTLSGPRPVGLAWHTILGFIRISTNPRFAASPWTPAEAVREVRGWLNVPVAEILTPGDRHAEILFGLLEEIGVAGNLTSDAHLAALAIEYQAELVSTDSDFSRFRGLRWFNPAELR
jgi:hypothetical protein